MKDHPGSACGAPPQGDAASGPAKPDPRRRYRVEHDTSYAYTAPVSQSWQLARLTPRALPWQQLLDHALRILTTPEMHEYRCEHPMRRQADALPGNGSFSQRQSFRESAGCHQLEGLDLEGRRGTHRYEALIYMCMPLITGHNARC